MFENNNRILRKRNPEDVILDESEYTLEESNKIMDSIGMSEHY